MLKSFLGSHVLSRTQRRKFRPNNKKTTDQSKFTPRIWEQVRNLSQISHLFLLLTAN